MQRKSLALVGVLALALVLALWSISYGTGGAGGKGGDAASNRFTVVHSEGFNLIVTDNQTNTLFFYSTDKDTEVGSDLHLRGSINLSDVGKATLKPKVTSKK